MAAGGAGPKTGDSDTDDDRTDNAPKGVAGAPNASARPEETHASNHGTAGAPTKGDGDSDEDLSEKGVAGAPNKEDGDSDKRVERAGGCSAPPIDKEKLGSCRDAAGKALEQGTDAAAASTEHQSCVEKAFGRRTGTLAHFLGSRATPADPAAATPRKRIAVHPIGQVQIVVRVPIRPWR